jgi:hypothetical protein
VSELSAYLATKDSNITLNFLAKCFQKMESSMKQEHEDEIAILKSNHDYEKASLKRNHDDEKSVIAAELESEKKRGEYICHKI